jgi:hypothetical protein
MTTSQGTDRIVRLATQHRRGILTDQQFEDEVFDTLLRVGVRVQHEALERWAWL